MLNFIKKIFMKNDNELSENITLEELKILWAKEHYKVLTPSGITGYETAWQKCQELHDKKFLKLKYKDWQEVIDRVKDSGLHYSSQKKVRNIIGQLYKFAGKYELMDKNYAPLLELDKNIPVHIKEPFSEEEVARLWDHKDEENMDIVLILIYTGVRISELLRLRTIEDIFVDDRYFIVRQSKTEAGRNRPVPINRQIEPFIKSHMRQGNEYLIVNSSGRKMNYSSFANRFKEIMQAHDMPHTIHECRHTCATLLDNAGANELATRRILGHAANNITKRVYTHKTINDLIKAIDLI